MDRPLQSHQLPKYCFLTGLVIMMSLLYLSSPSRAQVISSELRRLAMATNQFGIDTLRALDRIEPPDKVVSSLRHALYVWSMKPQEINRGFKDIFEHIGFNQGPAQQPYRSLQPAESQTMYAYTNSSSPRTGRSSLNDESRLHPIGRDAPRTHQGRGRNLRMSPISLSVQETVSLPALIKLKGMMEQTLRAEKPWWHDISRRSQDKMPGPDQLTSQTATSNLTIKEHRLSSNQNDSLESSQMSALSNIYIQRGLTMNYNYNLLLRQYYKTVIHPVDFLRNSEETRLHINALVASSTENKIKDLVKKNTFESKLAPKIMMISTFHFRGTLDIEMKARNKTRSATATRARRSRNSNGRHESSFSTRKPSQTTKVAPFIETESTPLKYGHFSSLGCSVIEIPFDNRLVTLVIVMPDERNSTDLLLTRLSAQILSDLINSLVVKRLSLGIPVIKFDRGPINMDGLLQELGLDNLFYGDKPYSTETGLNRWLRPADVVHETSIDIGTINPDWAQPEDRLKLGAHDGRLLEANHIKLDKPFFYFVMDSMNSMILTMGRIRQ